jgi:hypothetical protein
MKMIEDIDLIKADYDHGMKVQMQLNQISTHLRNLQIGQPLVWLYVWDTVCSIYDMYAHDEDDVYTTRPGLELDEVWNELWTNHPGFTLEYGPEALEEHIQEWMVDLGYIVDKDDLDTTDE